MITIEQLMKIMPAAGKQRAALFLPLLNKSMPAFGITTPARQASFLAQIAHESTQLTCLEESLTYREAARIMTVWSKRFPSIESAVPYVRNPAALGNFVYAGRMGNGDVASGDGFRFRGRGLIQTTGRANYEACGKAIGIDLVACPQLLQEPKWAVVSACSYWLSHGLNALADACDQVEITKRINGGTVGLKERMAIVEVAHKVLTC